MTSRRVALRPLTHIMFSWTLAALLLVASGCEPMLRAIPVEALTGQMTSTPTPNPTLLAVRRMLTMTAAAPTVTPTPSTTPTRRVTATATTEVVLAGSQKKPAPAGQPFSLGGMTLHVLSGQLTTQAGRLKAQEGQTYLDLEVLLQNQGEKPVSYTPFYLSLAGPGEQRYQPAVDSLRPGLLSGTLRSGEQVRGHVAFAIPEPGATGDFRLVFRPELADLPPGSDLREAWIELMPAADENPAPETSDETAGEQALWPPDGLPRPGERVEAAGVGLTIGEVEVQERIESGKAGTGNRFVVMDVQIENVNHARLPYNPLSFRVKDAAGYEYQPTASPDETTLQAGTLAEGRSITAQLIFEVPLGADPLVLSYLPGVLFEDYEEIRFAIDLN